MFDDVVEISTYTRADAIADGTLVAIDTQLSKQAGIKFLVAVTHAVWEKYIGWDKEDTLRQTQQDMQGRLWDVLFLLTFAVRQQKKITDTIYYTLRVVPRDRKATSPRKITLKALCHPGDEAEPVITIMLPEED